MTLARFASVRILAPALAVTAGLGIEKYERRFEDAHDDYSSIMLKSLADRLAEALAEYLHQRVRTDLWGYVPDEHLSNAELIKEAYVGIRPAPGYPACPEHTVKADMFRVLQAEEIGMQLTESYAMYPGAAVSGFAERKRASCVKSSRRPSAVLPCTSRE